MILLIHPFIDVADVVVVLRSTVMASGEDLVRDSPPRDDAAGKTRASQGAGNGAEPDLNDPRRALLLLKIDEVSGEVKKKKSRGRRKTRNKQTRQWQSEQAN